MTLLGYGASRTTGAARRARLHPAHLPAPQLRQRSGRSPTDPTYRVVDRRCRRRPRTELPRPPDPGRGRGRPPSPTTSPPLHLPRDVHRRGPAVPAGDIERAAARGAWIHTVSHHVRRRGACSTSPLPPARVATGPNGIVSVPMPTPAVGRPWPAITLRPRASAPSNLARTTPAWCGRSTPWSPTKQPDLRLVVAGGDGWGVGASGRRRARPATPTASCASAGCPESDRMAPAARRRAPGLRLGLRGVRASAARGHDRRHPRGGDARPARVPEVVGYAAEVVPVGDIDAWPVAMGHRPHRRRAAPAS